MFQIALPRAAASCALVAITLATPVSAQQMVIDDIIVTARKREESLQEVPLSITALTSEQIESRGITNNYDVALFTPNFSTQKQVGRTNDRPTIRGMAASSIQGEPNASYFIDGVFVASSISTAITEAVERVEVLRGPQSAQFGRATFSGAIAYVTKQPTNEWEGQLNARAGEDEDYKLGGWISGPIIEDKLAFLASATWDQWDGEWQNNLREDSAFSAPVPPFFDAFYVDPPQQADNSKLGGEETKDVLFKLAWTPLDDTLVNLKFNYTEGDDDHFPSEVPLSLGSQLNCFLPGPDNPESGGAYCGTWDPSGYENRVNLPDIKNGVQASAIGDDPVTPEFTTDEERFAKPGDPGLERQTYRVLADFTQGFGDWDIQGRASYNKDDFTSIYDLDHTEVRGLTGLFNFEQRDDQHDYSFELKAFTPSENRLRGSLGGYYYFYQSNRQIRSFFGPSVAFETFDTQGNLVTTSFPTNTRTETENIAAFGTIEFDITDRLTASLESRYARDTKKIRGGNLFPLQEETSNFTPRWSLRYQATDGIMGYLLAAKGNKPTDFNAEFFRYDIKTSGTQKAIDNGEALVSEEENWTYEIGTKTQWFDNRVTANLAAFYIDWTNQALFTVIEIAGEDTINGQPLNTTIRENAGETDIYGLELETNFFVTDSLMLIANYGYQHTEFQEGTDSFLARTTGGDGELEGNEVANAPKHSVVLGVMATRPINAELEASLRFDYIYESDRYVQSGNFNKLDDRKLANMRLGIGTEAWTLTGYVNNLLDDDTPWAALNFVDFANQVGGNQAEFWSLNPNRGRNFGLEFNYRFIGFN
jgi:outer membrane receptor protein involved in Fe transport